MDAVVEHVPVGVLILDADLNVIRTNRALCEMTGIEDGHVGKPLRDVLPWLPEADVRRALETGVGAEDVELQSAEAGRAAHRFAVSLLPLAAAGAPAVACLVRDVAELVAWRRGLGGIERLAADLSGAATLADVTDLIVSRSRELVGAETVAAALLTDDGGAFEVVGMAGFDEPTAREWSRFGLDIPTPMRDCVRSGEPVFLDGHDNRAHDYPVLLRLAAGEAIAAVPIRGRAGVLGAISFRFPAGHRLERGDRSLMLTIGQHYGQALDRAKLFEAAESERQRLEALMNQLPVGVAIAEAPTGHIVAVNAKATEIWRAPPAGAEPITDVTPYVAFHPDGRRFSPDDWPIARSLATGEVVENEEVDVEFSDGTRGWVNISARPVLDAAGTVLGAVTTLVDVTEPRRRETEARFLAEATDLLTESLDPEEALRRLARLVVPRLADWCVVYIREGSRIRTVALEHSDPKKIELGLDLNRRYPTDPDGEAGVALVMRTGRSQLTPRLTREMLEAAAPDAEYARVIFDELGLRSALTVPLRARGQLFGALILVSAESDRVFDERDVAFAEDFATHAALAVANARLYAEQQEIARTLQRSLLPLRLPDIPDVEMVTRYRPAGEHNMVGGDFYDLWEIGQGQLRHRHRRRVRQGRGGRCPDRARPPHRAHRVARPARSPACRRPAGPERRGQEARRERPVLHRCPCICDPRRGRLRPDDGLRRASAPVHPPGGRLGRAAGQAGDAARHLPRHPGARASHRPSPGRPDRPVDRRSERSPWRRRALRRGAPAGAARRERRPGSRRDRRRHRAGGARVLGDRAAGRHRHRRRAHRAGLAGGAVQPGDRRAAGRVHLDHVRDRNQVEQARDGPLRPGHDREAAVGLGLGGHAAVAGDEHPQDAAVDELRLRQVDDHVTARADRLVDRGAHVRYGREVVLAEQHEHHGLAL